MSTEKTGFIAQASVAVIGFIGVVVSVAIPAVVTTNSTNLQTCLAQRGADKKIFVDSAQSFLQSIFELDNRVSDKEWLKKNKSILKEIKKKSVPLFINSPITPLDFSGINKNLAKEVQKNFVVNSMADQELSRFESLAGMNPDSLKNINMGTVTMGMLSAIYESRESEENKDKAIFLTALWNVGYQQSVERYDISINQCHYSNQFSLLSYIGIKN